MSINGAESFYNGIADKYHWFLSSWDKIMDNQAGEIGETLERFGAKKILDCSCGSGLQAVGLAKAGYSVDAGDISESMLERAKEYAREVGVHINLKRSDFRYLEKSFRESYDCVISWGNSIPHLMSDGDILLALCSMRGRLMAGGILLAEMRNYDVMLRDKVRFLPMRINDIKDGCRYSIIYVFDYPGDIVRFNVIYLVEDLDTGEKRMETRSVDYNPISRERFTALLAKAGFGLISASENERTIAYTAKNNG